MIFYFFPDNLEVLKNIAIFFGALGGVAAFLTLIIKDQFKIKQIDKLSNIASNQEGQLYEMKNSVEQLTSIAGHQGDQLHEMAKSTEQLTLLAKYQKDFNAMYEKNMGSNKANLEYQKQKHELDIKLKKVEIRPEFKYNGGISLKPVFINIGERAEIISSYFLDGETKIPYNGIAIGKTIEKNERFYMIFDGSITVDNREKFILKLGFKDSIGTKYYQNFDFRLQNNFYKVKVSKVIELKEEPPEPS